MRKAPDGEASLGGAKQKVPVPMIYKGTGTFSNGGDGGI